MVKVYPDVCIVWPHRDPTKSVASTVSILGTIMYGQTDESFKANLLDQYMDPHGAAQRLTNVIDQIESCVLPKDRIYNVLYRDLVANPVETAAKIHAYFKLPFSAESRKALQDYVRQNPREIRRRLSKSKATGADHFPWRRLTWPACTRC
jgi:hypothetical protein